MIESFPKTKPIRLKGKAYTNFRKEVFEAFSGRCSDCGKWVPFEGPSVFEQGHVSHIKSRGAGGSDILSNVNWKCYNCHIVKEHGPQWSTQKEAT